MIAVMAPLLLSAYLPSTPELGTAEGRCRRGEQGPALLVEIDGLKDRHGRIKLELYPANDTDFLQDDNLLVAAGKTFRRVEAPVPAAGTVELCIRAPSPGTYALAVLHDRDGDHRFSLSIDGIGFGSNPKLGWSKPKAAGASVLVGPSPTPVRVVMNYRRGLLSFGPTRK